MKKTLIILLVAVLKLIACSKDPLEKESAFFYFDIKYGRDHIVEFGHNNFYDYYGGPMYRPVHMPDSTLLFLWPDYDKPGPYLTPFPISFTKKGSGLVGDYTLMEKRRYSFAVYTGSSGSIQNIQFHPIPGSEKLRITKAGDSRSGKFAEGNMDFDTYIGVDTVNVIRASAMFRLKMQ
jgi:hypothetical protein